MSKQQYILFTLIGFSLYLISTGISFAAFSYFSKPAPVPQLSTDTENPQNHFDIDPTIPKTEECPLNGKMFTKEEKEIWEKRRPLAVMIENHADSRPQSGLSKADVVYEAVAEGGITRFMGIYYCDAAYKSVQLAPVRSARTYYLPWILEYDALYNHVGGAGLCNDSTVDQRAKALCQIQQYKIKDMDQFGISFPTCFRNYDRLDHEVATEHTMVCVTDKLYELAKKRGWTDEDEKGVSWDKNFQPWKFKDDAKLEDRGASFSAKFVAWSGYENDYGVRWDYDKKTNVYKRYNGNLPHIDIETEKQLTASVIAIIFVKEIGPVDDHAHLLYNNIGSGNGLLLQDGEAVSITWKKPTKSSRTKYYDKSGKEVLLNRGQNWVEMLPIGTDVEY
ncbi:DUF3048 domain-containing protein [Patescibacteria group bacterium]